VSPVAGRPERTTADVVVVGGGPAGSATALLLARRGLDVLIVERETHPRPKPCGECLSPRATELLARLGVLDAVEAAEPARLAGWRIVAPAGAAFEAAFRDVTADPRFASALAIGRDRLDAILFEAAVRAGARTRTGVRVLDVTRSSPGVLGMGRAGRFEARGRLVVGADGLRSVVARRIGATARNGRLRKLSLTGHMTGIPPDGAAFGEMHIADGMCAGIAPVDRLRTIHNVTLVVDAARFGRAAALEPVAFFRRSLDRFPRLRARVRDAGFAGDDARGRTGPLLASGPFDRPTRHIVTPGYALVGDAAGYYDPFTGQGIGHALAAAALLAGEPEVAGCDGASSPWLRSYQKSQRRLVRGARLLQHIIEAVISRPGLADRAIARLAGRPEAGRALLAATGDMEPPFDALSPAVLFRFLTPRTPEARRT
jgi:flavin-dependent dehydrogenase